MADGGAGMLGGMPDYATPKYFVTYLTEDQKVFWQDEYAWIPPAIGNGIVGEDGKLWRIRDVWEIHEKRGGLEYGVYAFISPVTPEDNTLARVVPDYC